MRFVIEEPERGKAEDIFFLPAAQMQPQWSSQRESAKQQPRIEEGKWHRLLHSLAFSQEHRQRTPGILIGADDTVSHFEALEESSI